jgi:uncharacterized protein (TIGR02271 family)
MATKSQTVVGVFRDKQQAQDAIQELRNAGFRANQIGVLAKDKKLVKDLEPPKETYAGEGAAAGVVTGAAIGTLWGLGLAAGMALPVLGPVIAGGTVASVIASAATGAVAAGVVGFLIGLGIPEEHARYYERELKAGRIIVTVKTGTRETEAREIFVRHGGYDATAQAAATSADKSDSRTDTTASARTNPGTREARGADRVEVREEEVNVRKQPVKKGEVRVRKDVVTERRAIDVPVEREEVVVERRPVRGRSASGGIRDNEEVRIPVEEEEVFVEKRPVVREEIAVGKRRVQDTRHVEADVRKERARVEQEGKVNLRNR